MLKMKDEAVSESGDVPETVKKSAWSNSDRQEVTSLKKLLRPFLYSMALAGCYNFSDIHKNTQKNTTINLVLSRIYRAAVIIIIFFYVAKTIAAFFYLPNELFQFNGLVLVWLLSVVATYLVNIKATTSKYGQTEKAFEFWEEKIIKEFQELEIKFPASKMKKRIMIVQVLGWFAVIGNVVATGAQIYIAGPDLLASPFNGTPAIIVLVLILTLFTSALWLLPTMYVVMINKLIYEAFNAFNKFNCKYCKKHGCKMSDDFHKVRLLHMNLCKLVKDFDEDLGWFYASAITFSIGMSVFNLYQIMKTSLSTYELALFLLWFSSQMGFSALLTFYAAYVNDAAHTPLDTIYYINVQDITVEKLAQLNLFLSKLTGTQVGFTTCGLLVITKEFILTIAGVFLTYFAVLYTL